MTKQKPRILFFDIETAPVLAWIWRVGREVFIGHEQIRKGQKFDIICIAWKWQGEKELHSLDWGLNAQNSADMIEKFSKVIASADICVSHNGDNFDIKQLNTQRLLNGQDPISWPTSEDTLKQFRKHFAFPSYKLDYLAKTLLGRGKGEMHFQDWIDVVENRDAEALDKMIRYCKNDVLCLAQMFNKAKKHMIPKAHAGLIMGRPQGSCPRCGSMVAVRDGFKVLAGGRYQRFQCFDCGHKYRSHTKLVRS